ncbi:MAG: KpsF/GutQ family sugar-phosphate isomerase [Luminiphilus sp.]|jgi:arabinose-5-phosphate isomerase
MHSDSDQLLIDSAKRTIGLESAAVLALLDAIGPAFAAGCRLLMNTTGRVVVTGMGKSGHVAGKIAATLASTGTPAFFVHPGEASHGDMGMITRSDCVLALSNSGNTQEIITLLPLIKRLDIPLISITGDAESELAQASAVHLLASVESEACPLNLAPTSSTTAALVMGDALAIAVLEARGFTAEEFAFSHPGGALGKRLLLRVSDVMVKGDEIPRVLPTATLIDALDEITRKGLGMTAVADKGGKLRGVFTDGDLRRAIENQHNLQHTSLETVMSDTPTTISEEVLAAEALGIMERRRISSLIIVDDSQSVCGVVTLLALLKAGIS